MKQTIAVILFAGIMCSCSRGKVPEEQIEPPIAEPREFSTEATTGAGSTEIDFLQRTIGNLQAELFVLTNSPDAYAARWISIAEMSLPPDYRTDDEESTEESLIYAIEADQASQIDLKRRQLLSHLQRCRLRIEELSVIIEDGGPTDLKASQTVSTLSGVQKEKGRLQ